MLVGLSTSWSVLFVEAIFESSLSFSYISLVSPVEQIRLRAKLKEAARLMYKRWHKECNRYCLSVI